MGGLFWWSGLIFWSLIMVVLLVVIFALCRHLLDCTRFARRLQKAQVKIGRKPTPLLRLVREVFWGCDGFYVTSPKGAGPRVMVSVFWNPNTPDLEEYPG